MRSLLLTLGILTLEPAFNHGMGYFQTRSANYPENSTPEHVFAATLKKSINSENFA
jgi:hypothetical protein